MRIARVRNVDWTFVYPNKMDRANFVSVCLSVCVSVCVSRHLQRSFFSKKFDDDVFWYYKSIYRSRILIFVLKNFKSKKIFQKNMKNSKIMVCRCVRNRLLNCGGDFFSKKWIWCCLIFSHRSIKAEFRFLFWKKSKIEKSFSKIHGMSFRPHGMSFRPRGMSFRPHWYVVTSAPVCHCVRNGMSLRP